jgi:phosphate acyltransferase
MARIAIEATGGDGGFEVVLAGAKKALSSNPGLELVLVAGEDKLRQNNEIESKLKLIEEGAEGNKYLLEGIFIETSFCTYDSHKNSNERVKSSIYKAIKMHKFGEVGAVIAPGDTRGAVFYAGKILELIPGVRDPAIPTHWPHRNVLIDSGANSRSTPLNLYQSAIMGHVFSKYYLGVENPLIGLLTNGTEDKKGNQFIHESRREIRKLKGQGYNILSNNFFEGDWFYDFNAGRVCVTDGHTGNIVLKTAETAIKVVLQMLKEKIMEESWIVQAEAKRILKRPTEKLKLMSYESYAAAPLLGVNGNVMICHGKSDAKAIENAIYLTDNYIQHPVNEKLIEEINRYGDPEALKTFINS